MTQKVETKKISDDSPEPRIGKTERPSLRFLSDWKCWSISALSLLTLVLLFQPWLTASGPYGDVHADAFGRVDGSVPALGVGERLTDGIVSLSGMWGFAAAMAAAVTLVAICLYWLFGVGLSAVVGAGAATAVLVPGVLVYLDGKAPELRAMTERNDGLKSALGDLLGNVFGGSISGSAQQAATVAMTGQALLCSLAAVLTGALAVSMRNSLRYTGKTRVLAEITAPAPATDAPAAVDLPAPEGGTVLQYRIDLALPSDLPVLPAGRPVSDDELGIDSQRLLVRTEQPRRSAGPVGPVRRDRPTARRSRPRPVNRSSAGSQSGTSAKRAAGPCSAQRSARQLTAG